MRSPRQSLANRGAFSVAILITLSLILSSCGAASGNYAGPARGTTGSTPTTISGVTVSGITSSGVIITWQTSAAASSQVIYGLTTSYGSSTTITDTTGTTTHSVNIGGLQLSTTYHFQVLSVDATGAQIASLDQTFTTASVPSTAPVISIPSASSITTSQASITWSTDIASDSQVEYGTTTAYGSFSAANSAQVTSHSIILSGLSAGTTYHYRVHSNVSVSSDFTFVTTAAALAVSNVTAANITANTAAIGWITNTAANSQVEYGTTTAYGTTTTLDPTLVTTHVVSLSGLKTATTYHFRVHSGSVVSGDFTFTTTSLTISSVSAGSITVNSATVVWATNSPANSQVDYGTTTAYGSSTTLDSTLVSTHSASISGLAPSTTYHFRVKSGTTTSGDFVFTTASGAISQILATQVTNSSALITWSTGIAGNSQVDYGTSTAYGSSTTVNPNLVKVHSVALSNLSANTAYHFRVHSGTAVSTDYVFVTLGAVPVDTLTLPTGFIGWQRLGNPSYTWSPTFGGTPSANGCGGASCAYMNSSLRFSPPDPVTQSPNQCLPDGWNNNGASVLKSGQVGFYPFNTACPASMNAQSSGIFDAARNRYCVMGGGHNDYYGTDVWCLDLTASPYSWQRVKDSAFPVNTPGAMGNTLGTAIKALGGQVAGTAYAECVANASTGMGCTPNSRHTTQGMQYLPGRSASGTIDNNLDTWFVANGGLTPNGYSAKDTWTLDLGAGISNSSGWRANYQMSNFSLGVGVGQPEQFGNTTAVDPRNSTVFMTDPGGGGGATRALWMFDHYGTLGVPNKWYRTTAVDAFKNSTDGSAAVWHNAADNHQWFIYVGGCRQDPITSISRTGGVVTATVSALNTGVWFSGQVVYVGQVSDGTFNVGDGTHQYTTTSSATVSGSTVTMTFLTGDLSSAASSGGYIYSCQRSSGSAYVNVNGVNVADITDTAAAKAGTLIPAFWTDNTMAASNLDVGGLGYNSCAEFLTGGSAPLKSAYTGYGSQSPGFVVDGYTGTIIGWPNEGPYVYEITPDPVNSRLACRRISFSTPASENPPNASVNGANSTWGNYGNGKMAYIPDADAFLLCNMPNAPCEILRLRSAKVVAGPVISGVSAINVTGSAATVVWSTDLQSSSQVDYGTTTSYGTSSTLDSTQVTAHSVALAGLVGGTTYHFRVRSGSSVSGDFTFTTTGGVSAPVISAIASSNLNASGATITWNTNIAANSLVEYGTSTAYGSLTTPDSALVTSHSEPVTGLSPSTTYHFRVHSGSAVSSDNTFTTSSVVAPPPPAGNNVTITDLTGATQLNRPISIPRVFVQGEIPHYAQPVLNGTTVTDVNGWQCDVKNRWPDGSLKFAIVSLVIPSLPASGTATISFVDNTSGNNFNALTPVQMLDPAFDFDVTTVLSGSAVPPRSISARSMLSDGTVQANLKYWLQGPVVTAVIIEDRTPARSYDTNTDGLAAPGGPSGNPLHPIFEAWFYPANHHVEVGATVENIWVSSTVANSLKDQSYSLAISQGYAAPVSCYSEPLFTHIGFSRWRRPCSTGGAAGAVHFDLNAPYILSTKMVANFDTSHAMTEAMLQTVIPGWTNAPKNIGGSLTSSACGGTGCVGLYEMAINGTGAHNYVGLYPKWDVLYLLSMDDRLRPAVFGNADLAGRMPIFAREADVSAGTGKFFDAPCSGCGKPPSATVGTVSSFGRVFSMNARQQETLVAGSYGTNSGSCSGNTADLIKVGALTSGGISGINADTSHHPDMFYLPYLLSGNFYYLEGLQMQAAFAAAQRVPCYMATSATTGRWAGRQGRWGLAYPSSSIRAQAWAFRTIAYAAAVSPDLDPESSYFDTLVKNQIAEFEGGHNVNGPAGTYGSDSDKAAIWQFGLMNDASGGVLWTGTTSADNRGPSPLGTWRDLGTAFIQAPMVTTGSVSSATSPWEESFMTNALGVARDLGYQTDGLLGYEAKRYFHLAADPQFDAPYLLETYREPTVMTANPNAWISDPATFVSAYQALPSCWSLVVGNTCTTGAPNLQDSHAYQSKSAISFMTKYSVDGYFGADLWNSLDSGTTAIPNKQWLYDAVSGNGSPVWSIVPRQ